jgi:hypothetical protein
MALSFSEHRGFVLFVTCITTVLFEALFCVPGLIIEQFDMSDYNRSIFWGILYLAPLLSLNPAIILVGYVCVIIPTNISFILVHTQSTLMFVVVTIIMFLLATGYVFEAIERHKNKANESK